MGAGELYRAFWGEVGEAGGDDEDGEWEADGEGADGTIKRFSGLVGGGDGGFFFRVEKEEIEDIGFGGIGWLSMLNITEP